MSTLHFHQTTTATPEQFVAGLTDFGPGRSERAFENAVKAIEARTNGAPPP
jgi:hypothetical protein